MYVHVFAVEDGEAFSVGATGGEEDVWFQTQVCGGGWGEVVEGAGEDGGGVG